MPAAFVIFPNIVTVNTPATVGVFHDIILSTLSNEINYVLCPASVATEYV